MLNQKYQQQVQMHTQCWGDLSFSFMLFRPLSIASANAAAPATRNGLVTLFAVHINKTI
jgi:hypothetical protein